MARARGGARGSSVASERARALAGRQGHRFAQRAVLAQGDDIDSAAAPGHLAARWLLSD